MSDIPVVLVTGFLGSGKTTLLNDLLKRPAFRDTAVIINEAGDAGIDQSTICCRENIFSTRCRRRAANLGPASPPCRTARRE